MTGKIESLYARLQARFEDRLSAAKLDLGEVTLELPSAALLEVGQALKNEPLFAFTQLIDLCGVDYSTYGQEEWITQSAAGTGFSRGVEAKETGWLRPIVDEPSSVSARDLGHKRFAVAYHLLSITHNQRVRLRIFAEDDEFPIVPSVITLWGCANWFEREAFDLFGIVFEGHPDLRRILTDYGFIGHPFRKDFPLSGNVEMRYDPEKQRVVYEPVSIEPRVLVPRVIRRDTANLRRTSTPKEDISRA
jgi:NADH:ubiquinone oxidoreductase 27 kD subunit